MLCIKSLARRLLACEAGVSVAEPVELEAERAALLELLDRIGTGPGEGAGPAHPLFGPLTWREWGVVTYKHADHHLKQFGA